MISGCQRVMDFNDTSFFLLTHFCGTSEIVRRALTWEHPSEKGGEFFSVVALPDCDQAPPSLGMHSFLVLAYCIRPKPRARRERSQTRVQSFDEQRLSSL